MLLAFVLLVAQLGVATHSLHLDAKQDGQKVELTSAFCIAGSHLGAAPTAPVISLDGFSHPVIVAVVRHVCELSLLATPRSTRGPPFSTT